VTAGLLWSIVATLSGAAGSLLVTPMMVHRLGPADYGLYVLVITVTSYASFLDFGLTWAATRYFADDLAVSDGDRVASRLATLAIVFGGTAVIVSLLAVEGGPLLMRAAGGGGGGEPPRIFFASTSPACPSCSRWHPRPSASPFRPVCCFHSCVPRSGLHWSDGSRRLGACWYRCRHMRSCGRPPPRCRPCWQQALR
jgi:hypothetical protein